MPPHRGRSSPSQRFCLHALIRFQYVPWPSFQHEFPFSESVALLLFWSFAYYLFIVYPYILQCLAPTKCSTKMSNERINSEMCKMHAGKHDFIGRCLLMACKALPPSFPVPSPPPCPFTHSAPVILLLEHTVPCPIGNFALTDPFDWKVPPLVFTWLAPSHHSVSVQASRW